MINAEQSELDCRGQPIHVAECCRAEVGMLRALALMEGAPKAVRALRQATSKADSILTSAKSSLKGRLAFVSGGVRS